MSNSFPPSNDVPVTKVEREENKINCPACDKPIVPPHASFSRFVNLYICSNCGIREAFEGGFWLEKFEKEKPTQPAGYNPFESGGRPNDRPD